jgi:hypothetical protein
MKHRRRIYFSAVQRAEIWNRWHAGESMKSIERRFDRGASASHAHRHLLAAPPPWAGDRESVTC